MKWRFNLTASSPDEAHTQLAEQRSVILHMKAKRGRGDLPSDAGLSDVEQIRLAEQGLTNMEVEFERRYAHRRWQP